MSKDDGGDGGLLFQQLRKFINVIVSQNDGSDLVCRMN